MKRIFKQDSLGKKLMAIFLAITIIPLVVTVSVIYYETDQGFTRIIENQQKEVESSIETQFDKVSSDLLDLSMIYTNQEDLVSAFQSGDRDELLLEVNRIFPRLQKEHGLEIFELGDTKGAVILRGHNLEKYGDDKSSLPSIQNALDGKASAGFEFGSSGLSVRAFTPIISNNKVIGTLQTGMDDSFLEDIKNNLEGVKIDLYDGDGTIVVSSEKDHEGKKIGNTSIVTNVKQGKTISTHDNENLQSFMPLYDPTKSEIIGIVGLSQNISTIQDTKQQITFISILIAVITFIIVLFVSLMFSKTITKPIKYIVKSMEELAKGNLGIEIKNSKEKNEIGQLVNAMQVMKNSLHQTIEKVADASTSVSAQSEELMESSHEVMKGSGQISHTMEEIATGTERQADHASEIAFTMSDFAAIVQETSNKGEQIQASSVEVLGLTNEGKQLMGSSQLQMAKIDNLVREAVQKMDDLNHQMQKISEIVLIIQKVADQTNLLALNASIEAARAGEQGKGFAVVANEVKKLAEQVSFSVADISGIVNNIQNESGMLGESLKEGYQEVAQGSKQIKTTGETFDRISVSITEMVRNIQSTSKQLLTIAEGSQKMNGTIEEMASISEESAAGVEETVAVAQQSSSSMEEIVNSSARLAKLAEDLNELIYHFKL